MNQKYSESNTGSRLYLLSIECRFGSSISKLKTMSDSTTTTYNVSIHSDTFEFPTEKRYDSNTKVIDLKKKLELITGVNYKTMKLNIFIGDKDIGLLSKDDDTLAEYLKNEQVTKDTVLKLCVKGEQPSLILTGGDTPKFTISDEKYVQRPNNARDFIKQMREKRMSNQ